MYEQFRVDEWPRMVRAKQVFKAQAIDDVGQKVREEFSRLSHLPDLQNKRIAVTVGSRGIRNLDIIVRETINCLKDRGAKPFILPAMGSHGGATAEGQALIIHGFGITEEAMGVPILSDTKVELAEYVQGIPIYISTIALEADGIVVLNRIKKHTSFRGAYESGLYKMMVVGLGMHKGTLTFHGLGFPGMAKNLVTMAKAVMRNTNIICGVGIVENALEETAHIKVIPGPTIGEEEPLLLKMSNSLAPRIPYEKIDILILKQLGKNISGDGMDPNITGRYTPDLLPDYSQLPRIKRIVTFDLTEDSHGCAIGMGHIDVTTERFRNKINFETTYMNAVSATVTNTCKMPIIAPDEKTALEIACQTCRPYDDDGLKICVLQDTLHLESMLVSESLYGKECAGCTVQYTGDLQKLMFGGDGTLTNKV